MNSLRSAATAAGCSTWGQCPASGTVTVRACWNRGATAAAIMSAVTKPSWAPRMIRTGPSYLLSRRPSGLPAFQDSASAATTSGRMCVPMSTRWSMRAADRSAVSWPRTARCPSGRPPRERNGSIASGGRPVPASGTGVTNTRPRARPGRSAATSSAICAPMLCPTSTNGFPTASTTASCPLPLRWKGMSVPAMIPVPAMIKSFRLRPRWTPRGTIPWCRWVTTHRAVRRGGPCAARFARREPRHPTAW